VLNRIQSGLRHWAIPASLGLLIAAGCSSVQSLSDATVQAPLAMGPVGGGVPADQPGVKVKPFDLTQPGAVAWGMAEPTIIDTRTFPVQIQRAPEGPVRMVREVLPRHDRVRPTPLGEPNDLPVGGLGVEPIADEVPGQNFPGISQTPWTPPDPMLAVGPQSFGRLLAGFHAMDEHFRTAPLDRNLPVLMGLLNVWYSDFFGAETVAVLADRHGEKLKKGKELALVAEVRIPAGAAVSARVALAWPQTYYNDSGLSVAKLVQRFGIDDWVRLVVVHDELDLPPGALRVKEGGGLAGNNGLRSIRAHLGTDEFVRVRIGVGKPPDARRGADHVLKRPGKAERTELDIVIQEAADAVETIATDGVSAAMTRFNRDRA